MKACGSGAPCPPHPMSSHPTTPVWLPWLYSRSIAIHLDGVDAALGPAPALQEGAVFHELQALACEVAALEDVYAEMFSMLRDPGRWGRKKEYCKSLLPVYGEKGNNSCARLGPSAYSPSQHIHTLVFFHEMWWEKRFSYHLKNLSH